MLGICSNCFISFFLMSSFVFFCVFNWTNCYHLHQVYIIIVYKLLHLLIYTYGLSVCWCISFTHVWYSLIASLILIVNAKMFLKISPNVDAVLQNQWLVEGRMKVVRAISPTPPEFGTPSDDDEDDGCRSPPAKRECHEDVALRHPEFDSDDDDDIF